MNNFITNKLFLQFEKKNIYLQQKIVTHVGRQSNKFIVYQVSVVVA